MKNKLKTIILAMLTVMSALPVFAQTSEEEPMMTIWTNRYETYGKDNNIQIAMTALQRLGHTTIEVDFGYGRKPFVISSEGSLSEDQENEVITGGTIVSGSVSKEGVIRFYGNPKSIDYVDCHGSNIYKIDISKMSELAIFECGHNELQALNTTGMQYLEFLDVKDNPFNEGLVLGNHNYLKFLNMNQLGDHALDHCNGAINLSAYPAIRQFTAWDSHCVRSIDLKKCNYLQQLSIDNTGVTSLDLSGNPYLMILNISDCGFSSIDLSKNTYLVELYADNQGIDDNNRKLKTLDLTNNTYLQRVTCAGNNLKELDITNLWNLVSLSASHNHLTSIKGLDYDEHLKNKELGKAAGPDSLAYVDLRYNNFSFATMPMVDPMTECELTNQFELPVGPEYGACETGKLDISKYVLREGTITDVAIAGLSRDGFSYDYQLMNGVDFDYDIDKGVITFLKEQPDSIQVACFNDYYEGVILLTTKFLVRSAENYGKPVELASFITSVNTEATINVATRENETLYVDFGNGVQVPFETTAHNMKEMKGDAAGAVRLFGRVGSTVESISIDNLPMTSADVNKLTTIKKLWITNCGLSEIDLGWNHLLRDINLSGNALKSLDLNGENNAFNKNELLYVNVSNNKLEFFDPGLSSVTILKMDCSNNLLPEINLNTMSRVADLNLSNNKLETVRLDDCTGITKLNISGNVLRNIDLSPCTMLSSLDITGNNFTYASLPKAKEGFIMAPQKAIKIAAKAATINLEAQAKVQGTQTVYTWKNAETGSSLTEGSDYTINNGNTTFSSSIEGQTVYCEMENALFPEFKGEKVLRTTNVTVTGMPQYCFGSFTTPVGGQRALMSLASTEPDTYIYIDWGDGELKEYPLQTMYTRFRDDVTIAGAEVKMYSNVADHGNMYVFSVDSVTMKNVDVSHMTELYCLTLDNAGLDDIDISKNIKLGEINFEGNHLTTIDLSAHKGLNMVTLTRNDLTEIKLAENNHIGWFAAAYNLLEDMDWAKLADAYNIDLAGNNLSSIDMKKLTGVGQLWISQNNLHEIDVEGHNLYVLDISTNNFDMTTLPYPAIPVYFYGNQSPLDVKCVNGKIDLSSQSSAWDVPSQIYFFEGSIDITIDDDGNAELLSDEYIEGTDFYNNSGIISFVEKHPAVTGLIVNELYPDLLLYTKTISVDADPEYSGIKDINIDAENSKVYDLQGRKITTPLRRGIYIKGGKTFINK